MIQSRQWSQCEPRRNQLSRPGRARCLARCLPPHSSQQHAAGTAVTANASRIDTFRTVVDVKPIEPQLKYSSGCLLLGSCFSDNIGSKLSTLKFQATTNPYGTIFNPASIAKLLQHTADPAFAYSASCLSSNGNIWLSFDHHSSLSTEDAGACLNLLNARLDTARASLRSSNFLILTLGTAWVYRYEQTGSIVANCHKKPARLFSKELLPTETTVASLTTALSACFKLNPDLRVILTISPVRHWKDGPVENQMSKASLILATHQICRQMPDRVQYFPAYEILLDDLRDYRFYEQDMLHPSQTAVDYIWDRLVEAWVDPGALGVMRQVEGLVAAIGHRPLHPGSLAYRSFLEQTATKLEGLEKVLPGADFGDEWGRLEAAGLEFH